MRFYSDENFPRAVVVELRRLGHDVLTAFEDGRANKGIDDEKVLARANKLGRCILTINRIYLRRLHECRLAHAGIVICTHDPDRIGQANRIVEACGADELKGKLVKVYRPST